MDTIESESEWEVQDNNIHKQKNEKNNDEEVVGRLTVFNELNDPTMDFTQISSSSSSSSKSKYSSSSVPYLLSSSSLFHSSVWKNLSILIICFAVCVNGKISGNNYMALSSTDNGATSPGMGIARQQLENWAAKFGNPLFEFGRSVTKYSELQGRFQYSESEVKRIDLSILIKEYIDNINKNFEEKVEAIKKIGKWAEEKALEFFEKPRRSHYNLYQKLYESKNDEAEDMAFPTMNYINAKDKDVWSKLITKYDARYLSKINTSFSSVHVPTSIWDKAGKVLEAIDWTSQMDDVFKSNYNANPSLLWQYFGSASGFLRFFPASKWPNDNSDKSEPDLYDARNRPWYASAANSPKNMIVLHDTSGSMTGLRREIAKHVVNTILETLTENDFVNVFNFSDETTAIVPCFEDMLVQANSENLREFKIALEQDTTAGIANFSSALNKAFDVLERNFNEETSAQCNQAIMIVSDGAPYYYEEIFQRRQNPMHYVRIFTYLIGRDQTDVREIKWMACANKGFYAHVSTLSEVQEKVLKYLPIMSKPLTMEFQRNVFQTNEVTWTGIYADVQHIAQMDWIWDEQNRAKQRDRSELYKKFLKKYQNGTWKEEFSPSPVLSNQIHIMHNPKTKIKKRRRRQIELNHEPYHGMHDYGGGGGHVLANLQQPPARIARAKILSYLDTGMPDSTPFLVRKKTADAERLRREISHIWGPDREFRFFISASRPVLDQRNSTANHIREFNQTLGRWLEYTEYERIANFLGVAGTDIDINDLKRITSPFKLGVNGYAFIINNNGHVVYHPDWRPIVISHKEDILKPNYNTVDLLEVELIDNDDTIRNNDTFLLEMRKDMINQEANYRVLPVRIHQDDFKRVHTRQHKYEYDKIPNTPYTLGLALHKEVQYYFHGEIDSLRLFRDSGTNVSQFFDIDSDDDKGNNERMWKLNPVWSYCRFLRENENMKLMRNIRSNEDLLLYFLGQNQNSQRSWKWRNTGMGIYPQNPAKYQSMRHGGIPEASRMFSTNEDKDIYECDKDLVQALVFDANITQIFKTSKWKYSKNESKIIEMYGALLAFVATRSGLTRWFHIDKDADFQRRNIDFMNSNNKATDELWYKRAVDRYVTDPDSFVFSVPFDAGTQNDSVVTATKAIFVKKNGREAPVAVVGIQFDHGKWAERFFDVTSKCMDSRGTGPNQTCEKTCKSDEYDCYVMDDNGYILYSEKYEDTGRFFGEIDGMVLEMLVKSDIYKRVKVTDYQAICFHPFSSGNFADVLKTPFTHLKWVANWFLMNLASMIIKTEILTWFNFDVYHSVLANYAHEVTDDLDENQNDNYVLDNLDDEDHIVNEDLKDNFPFLELASINKTRLRPCDKEYNLYTYGNSYNTKNFSFNGELKGCGHSGCNGHFNAHYIPHTNLILIVTDGRCRCALNATTIEPKEANYMKLMMQMEGMEGIDPQSEPIAQICRRPFNPLYRKRPGSCYAYNSEEEYIKDECGGYSSRIRAMSFNLLMIALFVFYFSIY